MSGAASKTNAVRLLDRLGIDYELRVYPHEGDLDAATVAAAIGLAPEQTYKTLVARGDGHDVLFAVLAADQSLDLKALARVSGHKRVELVALKEVLPLTGYVRGGCTALAARRDYPTFVDGFVELHERIAVSAGVRGTQIVLAPADYLRACRARVFAIAV